MNQPAYSMETMPQFAGRELGVSDWVPIDQATINAFAACTGDHQWIHTDPERCARESPFGAPIAHGFLTLSLLARLVMDVGLVPPDARSVINAGVNNVRFRTPVKAGQRVRARIGLGSAQPKGSGRVLAVASCHLEVENEAQPALTAEMAVMLVR